ncbi:hypothetical protein BFU36_08550 [Sulfolobus sp. A20]|uniref:hypothetical protein n=1 Tax=Saccharolobus sp. A20 TaxID=1891280 RepID=UPI000845E60B|nr:hypothetical protein [Sulfolobus sp. A20]TRM74661.1 hypothetical protein DJ532_12280 [Sulfolobus sp. A20-N-F8]TRM75969.1 hypothetical protein DJ528_08870 [Sulfolobus sp. B5]TRM80328.1 hypothetical protein DJ524_07995 [Sulfolobus sp. D5]TRM81319.1 hypothetical protein DJ522_07945 [Sulfolobus sp. F3]TRM86729.1 hypothetical protein DJ529_10515 [Sulfolobus sp. C3]TRM92006.1 hypothetical protein DJ526_06400 [Sulfolobus sp. A20-N-G8]TRM98400.1 hypothetical protein DJ530_10910 [Sulfolobus sp. E1
MRSIFKVIIGLLMLSSAIAIDYVGYMFQSLSILMLSMILAVAGALVGIRGLIEFLGDRFSK